MKRSVLLLIAVIFSFSSFAAIGPITGDTTVCAVPSTFMPVYMLDTTAGGVWSSSDTAIATIDSFLGQLTGISAGVVTITYTVGSGYVTTIITVKPAPGQIIAPVLCAGGTATFSDTTPGGYWNIVSAEPFAGDGAPTDSTFQIFGLGAGPLTLSYTASNGCTVVGAYFVYSSPPPITGITTTYVDSITTLSDSRTGGRWTSSNPSVATVGSMSGVVTGISPGVATIYYFAPCETSTQVTVLQSVAVPLLSSATGSNITIYPNPATTSLSISSSDNINSITIINLLGQTVYNAVMRQSDNVQINVADLPTGVYFVKVNGSEVWKFVKE